MVHGGPGGQARVGYNALVQYLVNHGYAVFDINNRGSSGYGMTFFAMDDRRRGEADLGDVVASKGMLTATGVVDPARIGIIRPLLVLQGANDPRVLQRESDGIVAAARKNGVPVEYIVFPDEGHGFAKKVNQARGYMAILEFLDTHLKK